MTFTSDQNNPPRKLSPISRKMLALRQEVFAQWEEQVRSAIAQSRELIRPVLINTLPSFYDSIAEALTPGHPRHNAVSTVATEHRAERARLTHYELKGIVLEYQLLRSVLLDTLHRKHVRLHDRQSRIISELIDNAIRESVTAYVVAQAALREKFAASLMHDLRNPLSSANMNALLISRTTDSPKIRALADKILAHHRRLDDMLHHLLDTMLFQSGARLSLHLTGFDLLALAQEVARQAQALHGPRFEVTGEPVSVIWSREEIKRALENLLGNAVKYGAAGTPILIGIQHVDERVVLSVHNQGMPISPEEIEDIFQTFQRARASRLGEQDGWGIGLPFVRAVAESHGGSTVVDSSLERGTTFSMNLPLDARPFQESPTLG